MVSLAASAAFVAITVRRVPGRARLHSPATLLTLTRTGAAALLAGRATDPGCTALRRPAWLALIWGATASDWLDGPLARRYGSSPAGAVLDLEADSWLTLSAAVAAARTGGLPACCLLAPLLRYAITALAWSGRCEVHPVAWHQLAGAAQMVALTGGLAPVPRFRRGARRLLPLAASAQLVALCLSLRRR